MIRVYSRGYLPGFDWKAKLYKGCTKGLCVRHGCLTQGYCQAGCFSARVLWICLEKQGKQGRPGWLYQPQEIELAF